MASIELTVAYPGREGAHSAAACDRLFPAARLVPLPTFSDVIDAVEGRVPTASCRSKAPSSAPSQRHMTSCTSLLCRSSPRRSSRSTTASSGRPSSNLETSGRFTATPSRSISAGGSSRRCRTRSPSRRRRRATPPRRSRRWPTRPSSRSRATGPPGSTGLTIIDGNVGDHPAAYTRFVSVAPYTRLDRRDGQWRTALHVLDRPPPRGALPRPRAALPTPHRPRPPRLAPDPVAARSATGSTPSSAGIRWTPEMPAPGRDARA